MDPISFVNSNGKTQWWKVYTEGADVVTESWLEGGKVKTHRKTMKGTNIGKKNEKTPEEHALSKAKSEWVSYRDKHGLGDKFMFAMLAHVFDDRRVKYPCYVQEKIDGIRCIIKDGRAYTRNGNPIKIDVPKTNFILDGEVMHPNLHFEALNGRVNGSELSEPEFFIWVFDSIDPNNLNQPYSERLKNPVPIHPRIRKLPGVIMNSLEEIEEYHDQIAQQGGEGLMVKNLDGVYKPTKRSYDQLKYKKFYDGEFEVTGHKVDVEGCVVWETLHGDVKMDGSKTIQKKYAKTAEKYYGKMLTVKYFAIMKDGKFRFPTGKAFREDL